MHDCVGVIIGGVQHTDGPLQVKYWGVLTPVTPAALRPISLWMPEQSVEGSLAWSYC